MVNGTTSSGFLFNIDETVLDDMEVIDAIAKGNSDSDFDKLEGLSILCKKILGKSHKLLYEHVKTEDGRVPTAKIEAELLEILKAIGEKAKNS